MTSKKNTTKNISNKEKVFLFSIIGFFVVVLILGIGNVYAYYHDSITSGILANKVGDFDFGDGDVNMMIYRENDSGTFTRVYAVPDAYYKFNDTLTSCTIPCNDGNGNCEYSYNSSTKNFSITSNQKVTCKFYFEKEANSDINIYVMVEDEDGSYTYNSKNYSVIANVPAYGYEYANAYSCENGSTLTYNSETKKFSITATEQDSCYAYFNKVGDSDITVNVYVQSAYGSSTYTAVETIPSNKIYVLNSTKSACDSSGATISYTDGYINITASGQQTCNVYLDVQSN